MKDQTPVHLAVVLDRSGSMQSIASDVVGGFNSFLQKQKTLAGDARVTLIQFDSGDPFEVLLDGVDLATTDGVDPARYQPRGMTPLYDAVGQMILRLDDEASRRRTAGDAEEDVVVVIITDGLENASRRWTRGSVFDLISGRKAAGWTFVFFGADQDAFASGRAMAVAPGSVGHFEKSPAGVATMYDRTDQAVAAHRASPRRVRRENVDRFLEQDL